MLKLKKIDNATKCQIIIRKSAHRFEFEWILPSTRTKLSNENARVNHFFAIHFVLFLCSPFRSWWFDLLVVCNITENDVWVFEPSLLAKSLSFALFVTCSDSVSYCIRVRCIASHATRLQRSFRFGHKANHKFYRRQKRKHITQFTTRFWWSYKYEHIHIEALIHT